MSTNTSATEPDEIVAPCRIVIHGVGRIRAIKVRAIEGQRTTRRTILLAIPITTATISRSIAIRLLHIQSNSTTISVGPPGALIDQPGPSRS